MIDAGPVNLVPIDREAAEAVLAGGQPRGLVLGPGFPSPFGMEIAGYAARRDRGDTRQAHYFIVHTGDRAIVGEIGSALDDSGSVQVGYGVTEPCRGRGYATAAVVARTAHLQPARVYATVPVDNVASRRVLEGELHRRRRVHRGRGRPLDADRPVRALVAIVVIALAVVRW